MIPFLYKPFDEQAWRFLTYQFVHVNTEHIVFNTLMQLVVGLPLEMSQPGTEGTLRYPWGSFKRKVSREFFFVFKWNIHQHFLVFSIFFSRNFSFLPCGVNNFLSYLLTHCYLVGFIAPTPVKIAVVACTMKLWNYIMKTAMKNVNLCSVF